MFGEKISQIDVFSWEFYATVLSLQWQLLKGFYVIIVIVIPMIAVVLVAVFSCAYLFDLIWRKTRKWRAP